MSLDKELLQGQGMTSLRTRQRLIERLTEKGISDVRVLEAMRDSPRHLFLDEALSTRAYEDLALPIGYQQTISQPYIVARMTEALVSEDRLAEVPLKKTLEIGTGCGYQTYLLAIFSKKVTSNKYNNYIFYFFRILSKIIVIKYVFNEISSPYN